MSRSFHQNRRRTWVVGINKSGKVVYREIAMGGNPKADDLMPFAVFPLCGKPTKNQLVNLWLAGVQTVRESSTLDELVENMRTKGYIANTPL